LDRLQAMRVFLTVVDRGSLSAAAVTLGMSLPTVSRVLATLERQLGVRLIARTTHGLTQTDAGHLYYRQCGEILEQVREAEAAVQSHSRVPTGELRVTAPVTFGRYHVSPSVAEFLERFPRLSFYLWLSDHCESLSEQRLDVAIRIAEVHDKGGATRRLGYVQRVVVGSREYFNKHAPPTQPADLSQHNCLHFTHYLRADEWTFHESGRRITVRVSGRMRTNNQEALVDAVVAGAGVAVLPAWLVRDDIESGSLQRVLTEYEAPRTPVYAVFPTRGPPPNKVRVFVEFLGERYRERGILSTDVAPGQPKREADATISDR
jgi:DNA-binding transcriptional LysR family regulator